MHPKRPPHVDGLTRRELLRVSAAGALVAVVGGCEEKPAAKPAPAPASAAPTPPPPPAQAARSLVVYCSADSDVAKPIFEAFTKETGIAVNPVFDTEATKTTGLTNRLLQEKDRPRADLFWSSEPFGTIRLARAAVLDDSTSGVAERDMQPNGGWPALLRDQRWLAPGPNTEAKAKGPRWYGFGSRARVIVYNTKLVPKEEAPTAYAFMTLDSLDGRVGMAKPQFGTTRGHMAMLVDAWGRGPFGEWLRDLKRVNLRLYDGNSAVVRAVANGEIHMGFTDSDDVFAGKREGWPVEMSFIVCPKPMTKRVPRDHPRWAEQQAIAKTGTLLIPNTISRIRGGQNPADAPALIDFLLSKATQRAMATSDSHNVPVDPELAKELAAWLPPEEHIASIDFEDAADVMDAAMEVQNCSRRPR